MRQHLGDEIAVLDGLDAFEIEDGRIGRRPATGAEYAKQVGTGLELRRNVIDGSEGANYSGGSSSAPGILPLMPSSVGLASDLADKDLLNYLRTTSTLPPRTDVIDPSIGANYTGGSSAVPQDIPLMPSSVGLAGCAGGCGCYDGVPLSDIDLAFGSLIEIEDVRIGRTPATGAEYAKRVGSSLEIRRNVVDPSEGANYSGGSSSVPEYIPLMPSSVGLAGLDRVEDDVFEAIDPRILSRVMGKAIIMRPGVFSAIAGRRRLTRLKGKKLKILKAFSYFINSVIGL